MVTTTLMLPLFNPQVASVGVKVNVGTVVVVIVIVVIAVQLFASVTVALGPVPAVLPGSGFGRISELSPLGPKSVLPAGLPGTL